jgi:hypothetical protein
VQGSGFETCPACSKRYCITTKKHYQKHLKNAPRVSHTSHAVGGLLQPQTQRALLKFGNKMGSRSCFRTQLHPSFGCIWNCRLNQKRLQILQKEGANVSLSGFPSAPRPAFVFPPQPPPEQLRRRQEQELAQAAPFSSAAPP